MCMRMYMYICNVICIHTSVSLQAAAMVVKLLAGRPEQPVDENQDTVNSSILPDSRFPCALSIISLERRQWQLVFRLVLVSAH